ncbi:hypothetical protein [Demequina sp. NBRC 110052]|uniref:hypothetical protein n=1 Tax=Demequina sp. NBRC 110052 TaxID=1570341 RepID=UPI000A00CE22|nr:hypothetical protein [Demequina sp. NBRC 110052]
MPDYMEIFDTPTALADRGVAATSRFVAAAPLLRLSPLPFSWIGEKLVFPASTAGALTAHVQPSTDRSEAEIHRIAVFAPLLSGFDFYRGAEFLGSDVARVADELARLAEDHVVGNRELLARASAVIRELGPSAVRVKFG